MQRWPSVQWILRCKSVFSCCSAQDLTRRTVSEEMLRVDTSSFSPDPGADTVRSTRGGVLSRDEPSAPPS